LSWQAASLADIVRAAAKGPYAAALPRDAAYWQCGLAFLAEDVLAFPSAAVGADNLPACLTGKGRAA
jgi:hypothetical protein